MTTAPPAADVKPTRTITLIAGLAVALALLGAAAWIDWRQHRRMAETAALVVSTHEVQTDVSRLLSLVQDTEIAERDYLVTGDLASLEPFEAGLKAVEQEKRKLDHVILSEQQKTNLAALESLIAQRLALSRRNVELRRHAGFIVAQQAVASGDGRAAMDAIRARAARMGVTQLALLDERFAAARREADYAARQDGNITGLSAALLIVVFTLLLRENRLRQRAQVHITRLNADLQVRAAQLIEANRELESFTYSVSHDLRAPLRHVHGYIEMLRRDTAGQLSEKAQQYMRTVSEAGTAMGQLIDDLLAFSRTARTEIRESVVDMNASVRDTIRGLSMEMAGRNIVWQTASLPPVVGDSSLLKQVLANLIGNAVKYSGKRDPARIEIGCAGEEHGRVILFVRDNGAGFDMRYAHRLFGVFQRLHRTEEFEGTGVGLAITRRIVARHGGRVWATGAVNDGATFYFTLKRSPAA